MKVKATGDGYYFGRKYEGDVFDVPAGTKGSWFEPVGGEDSIVPRPKRAPKAAKVEATEDAPSADDLN